MGSLVTIVATLLVWYFFLPPERSFVERNVTAIVSQMFQCPATEAIGQSLDRFIPQRFRQAHRQQIADFGQTRVTKRSMGALGSSGLTEEGKANEARQLGVDRFLAKPYNAEMLLKVVVQAIRGGR